MIKEHLSKQLQINKILVVLELLLGFFARNDQQLKNEYYSGSTISSMVKVSSRMVQLVEELFTLDMNGRTDNDGFTVLLERKIRILY